ncbi:MAG TPA: hypothetical protein VEX42_10790 [Microbacterium sp.]|nr:hypothetical protein [Microbacterium sp.]
MAYLYYGTENCPVVMPDRMLAHVKVVVATKLRRGESFMMTWKHPADDGATSIWLQPSIPLRFVFEVADIGDLDGEYIQSLARAANSSKGLVLHWEESAPAPGVRREEMIAA